MAELMQLDPAFEGLLREVAAAPESRLLRVPRGREVPRWLTIEAPSSASDMTLGLAERELVRVGRQELAWLFRQAALRELIDGERTRDEVIQCRAVDVRMRPLDREAIARQVGSEGSITGEEADSFRVLERWLRQSSLKAPTAAELAAASMRFAPTAHARAIAGPDYLLRGDIASAREWLEASLLSDATSKRAVTTWNNLALTYVFEQRPDRALAAYENAVVLAPTNAVARAGVVVSTVLLGDATLLRNAASQFDSIEEGDERFCQFYGTTIRGHRRRGLLVVSPSAAELAKKCETDFQVAGRVIHELC
ncbi:MAG: hypothetical protein HZA53_16180 [Planctomycetes bacterium]|nr:hypothetical protein [Planctomycetota bacterium]